MTPQEQDLIDQLIQRLKQQAGQAKDPEAEALIRRAVQDNPDAPYLLIQTVLIQDMALHNTQAKMTELERQLAEARAQAQAKPTSFLGNLLGGGNAPTPRPPAPQAGPWGQPQPPQQQPAAPVWGPGPQQGYAQGGYPQGGYPQQAGYPQGYQPGLQPSATSGFLRSAATTAVGIAGGALLFEGIQSMFGGHHGMGGMGGMLSNASMQPSLTETTEIINNNYYYGNDPNQGGTRQADYQTPDSTPDSNQDNSGYQRVADERYDDNSGQDFASNDDQGGGGGGDDYA